MQAVTKKPDHYYRLPRREMLQYVPSDARRILEIGCGDGLFGHALKRNRASSGVEIEVTGIEIVAERAAVAASHLDKVLVADVERDELELPSSYYDCIVLNDVLEHLVSPWQALTRLATYLRGGGYVVASIPNVRYWGVIKGLVIDGDWRYEGDGVLDVTHLRFFTRRSIGRMFEECDYEVINITGINPMVRGWKFELLRLLSGGALNDIRYWQFAVVAKKRA